LFFLFSLLYNVEQDCDEALLKIGNVVDDSAKAERQNVQTKPLLVSPEGLTRAMVEHTSSTRGAQAGQPSRAGEIYEDKILAEYCPIPDEEVFGTYDQQPPQLKISSTASEQLLTPGTFPPQPHTFSGSTLSYLDRSETGYGAVASPSTPPVTYFGGLGTGPPPLMHSHLAGRPRDLYASLTSSATLMTSHLGEDELFEVVPDHFDFDLDDMEVRAGGTWQK
jgi:hypothetical protein